MSRYTVSLPSGDCFPAQPEETLLQAARRSGWAVPFGCRNGNCGACEANLRRGRAFIGPSLHANQARILLCQTRAADNLEIEFLQPPVPGSAGLARHDYSQLVAVRPLANGSWHLAWQLGAGRKSQVAQAGQYLMWEVPGRPPLRGYIDPSASSGRSLVAHCTTPEPPVVQERGHLRWPLGYGFVPPAQRGPLWVMFQPARRQQADLLLAAHAGAQPIAISADRSTSVIPLLPPEDRSGRAAVLAVACCASVALARHWFEQITDAGVPLGSLRGDGAVWRRWRVVTAEHAHRRPVTSGLLEAAARAQARALADCGVQAWAEPLRDDETGP